MKYAHIELLEVGTGGNRQRHECRRGDQTWGETLKELDQQKHQGTVIERHDHISTKNNATMKVEMSDGRVIVGIFLCTDRSGNVIIGEDECATGG